MMSAAIHLQALLQQNSGSRVTDLPKSLKKANLKRLPRSSLHTILTGRCGMMMNSPRPSLML